MRVAASVVAMAVLLATNVCCLRLALYSPIEITALATLQSLATLPLLIYVRSSSTLEAPPSGFSGSWTSIKLVAIGAFEFAVLALRLFSAARLPGMAILLLAQAQTPLGLLTGTGVQGGLWGAALVSAGIMPVIFTVIARSGAEGLAMVALQLVCVAILILSCMKKQALFAKEGVVPSRAAVTIGVAQAVTGLVAVFAFTSPGAGPFSGIAPANYDTWAALSPIIYLASLVCMGVIAWWLGNSQQMAAIVPATTLSIPLATLAFNSREVMREHVEVLSSPVLVGLALVTLGSAYYVPQALRQLHTASEETTQERQDQRHYGTLQVDVRPVPDPEPVQSVTRLGYQNSNSNSGRSDAFSPIVSRSGPFGPVQVTRSPPVPVPARLSPNRLTNANPVPTPTQGGGRYAVEVISHSIGLQRDKSAPNSQCLSHARLDKDRPRHKVRFDSRPRGKTAAASVASFPAPILKKPTYILVGRPENTFVP